MLKKRIIPCLDIKNGRTVKGINFKNIKDAGDPIELAKRYVEDGADELVFLDISATQEKRKILLELVGQIAACINIPFTVGGGIAEEEMAAELLFAGADKISINSGAIKNPDLIENIASRFGSQCVTVAIDSKEVAGQHQVYSHGGNKASGKFTLAWVKEVYERGAGEILLTSIDHDGKKNGFAHELTNVVAGLVPLPVIASGGAGNSAHFYELFRYTKASAGLAASIFHYKEVSIPSLKTFLNNHSIPVRCN